MLESTAVFFGIHVGNPKRGNAGGDMDKMLKECSATIIEPLTANGAELDYECNQQIAMKQINNEHQNQKEAVNER